MTEDGPEPGQADEILWDYDAGSFPLPEGGGIGRFQQLELRNGLTLYRSEFRVVKDCVIGTAIDDRLESLLCNVMLLSGAVRFQAPDGEVHEITPERCLLFRSRDPDIRLLLPAGHVIRHVGVVGRVADLLQRFGDAVPEPLHCFAEHPPGGVVVRRFPMRPRLRKLVSEIFTTRADDALQQLALEAQAQAIQAELLRCYIEAESAGAGSPVAALWGESVFADMLAHLRGDLAQPHSAADLARRFGLSARRIEGLFRTELQCSLADFLRRERMTRARSLMVTERMPVKAAAHAVGYGHVSNFSKAYRAFFGETPGQTQRIEVAP